MLMNIADNRNNDSNEGNQPLTKRGKEGGVIIESADRESGEESTDHGISKTAAVSSEDEADDRGNDGSNDSHYLVAANEGDRQEGIHNQEVCRIGCKEDRDDLKQDITECGT